MTRKNIISVVCLILVVGLAIDVSVAVDPLTETSQKIIGIICNDAGVDYQKKCEETLQAVTGPESVDPKALIVTIVKGTADYITRAMNMSDRIMAKHHIDAGLQSGMRCCKENLDSAMDSINDCVNVFENETTKEMLDETPNVQNSLSAAASFLETITTDCFETDREYESQFYGRITDKTLNNAKQFVVMSLNIAAGLSQIVEQLKSQDIGLKLLIGQNTKL